MLLKTYSAAKKDNFTKVYTKDKASDYAALGSVGIKNHLAEDVALKYSSLQHFVLLYKNNRDL